MENLNSLRIYESVLVTVTIYYIFKIDSKIRLLLTLIVAGYFGGFLWGILFNPAISIFYTGLIGSGIAIFL
jgi:hypothetical protein